MPLKPSGGVGQKDSLARPYHLLGCHILLYFLFTSKRAQLVEDGLSSRQHFLLPVSRIICSV